MKVRVRWQWLMMASVVLLLVLFPQLVQDNHKKTDIQGALSRSQAVSEASITPPVRLTIPTINVQAEVVQVGLTAQGAMEVPGNAVDVGWLYIGPRPGEKGSAVMAGHFDGENGEAGVFNDLDKLRAGDKLYVEDEKGEIIAFAVRENRIYDPGFADEVFNQNDGAHLNLVTCDGVWEGKKKSYSKRLVVFTDKIALDNNYKQL